jgi:hypothetical protein
MRISYSRPAPSASLTIVIRSLAESRIAIANGGFRSRIRSGCAVNVPASALSAPVAGTVPTTRSHPVTTELAAAHRGPSTAHSGHTRSASSGTHSASPCRSPRSAWRRTGPASSRE